MLRRIDLKNFILIQSAHLDVNSVFCAITGESGSGKSMILEAIRFCLSLSKNKDHALKEKAESTVALEFNIEKALEAKELLLEAAIDFEDDVVIIRKVVTAEQKTKCFINDISVNASLVRNLADCLIEIHSQNDKSFDNLDRLAIKLLDDYGKIKELRELKDYYKSFRQVESEISILREESQKTALERSFYEFAISEIDAVNIKENEETELEILKNTASNAMQVSELINDIKNLLSEEQNATSLIWSAQSKCAKLHDLTCNLKFKELASSLEKVAIELEECSYNIEKEMTQAGSEQDLERINDRLYLIKNLSRKYSVPSSQLSKIAEDFKQKLERLNNFDDKIARLEKEKAKFWGEYQALAQKVSTQRKVVAKEICGLINNQLQELKMEGALIEFSFNELSPDKATGAGLDHIEILAKINQKQVMQNIKDIASGGEKSRILLVIKSIANAKSEKTLIFDEIDSGIGGATASAVGRKIKSLSKSQQILLITHNAQVAAMSDQLFKVIKNNNPSGTCILIEELSNEAKKSEIARMISGDKITDEALAQAANLILT